MKKLIYIAEDERTIRETLKSFLENDGYEVCAFPTGDALLGAFAKRRADLVVHRKTTGYARGSKEDIPMSRKR